MSEVGRTEKDEKIAELEVWVFRELSRRLGAQKRGDPTGLPRSGSRFAVLRACGAGSGRGTPGATRFRQGSGAGTYT